MFSSSHFLLVTCVVARAENESNAPFNFGKMKCLKKSARRMEVATK